MLEKIADRERLKAINSIIDAFQKYDIKIKSQEQIILTSRGANLVVKGGEIKLRDLVYFRDNPITDERG